MFVGMSRGKSLGAVYARAAGRRVPDLAGLLAYRGLSRSARLLVNELYRAADNWGNFFATKGTVAEYLYPDGDVSFDEVDGLLAELGDSGLVEFYTVDGRRFLHLVEWVERCRGAVIVPLAPCQGGLVDVDAVGDGFCASSQVLDNEDVQDVRQVGDVLDQELDLVDGVSGSLCAEVAPSWRVASPSLPPEPPITPPHAHDVRACVYKGSRFVKVIDGLEAVDVVGDCGDGLGCTKEEVMSVMAGSFWARKLQDGVVIEGEAESFLVYYARGRDARGRRVHSWQQRAIEWIKNAQERAAAAVVKAAANGRSNGVVAVEARNK